MKKNWLSLKLFIFCLAIFSFALLAKADITGEAPTSLPEKKNLPQGGKGFDDAVEITSGNYTGFQIDKAGKYYYKIQIKPGQLLSVKSKFVGSGQYAINSLDLFDSKYERIQMDSSNNMTTIANPELSWLSVNTVGFSEYNPNYFIVIGNTEDIFKVSSFTLDVSLENKYDAGSESDAPKGFDSAVEVTAPGKYSGYFSCSESGKSKIVDGNDMYKMNIPAGKTLTVVATPDEETNLGLALTDSEKNSIGSKGGNNLGSKVTFSYPEKNGGNGYLKVYVINCAGNKLISYDFELSLSDTPKKIDGEAANHPNQGEDKVGKAIGYGILAYLGISFLLPILGIVLALVIAIIIVIIIVKKSRKDDSISNSPAPQNPPTDNLPPQNPPSNPTS